MKKQQEGTLMRTRLMVLLVVILVAGVGTILLISKTNPTSRPSVSNPSNSNCAAAEAPLDLVGCIRNEDIQWYWTFSGLEPRLSGMTAQLWKNEENIEPKLLDALLDEIKFAAAHVLLSYRSQGTFMEVAGAWNGLQVDLFADGHISYEGNDLDRLHARWEKELQH
jgi:hypothetical protein